MTLDEFLEQARERVGAAQAEVDSLCLGSRKWTMCIPVREETDSDCVIYAPLRDAERLLAIIEAQREAIREAEGLVSAHEEAVRADNGNTNVAVFREKVDAIAERFSRGEI